MADNLYDTGAPKRVIVEHRIVHEHRHDVLVRRAERPWCNLDPSISCRGVRPELGEPCAECPLRPKSRITITPEFQPCSTPKQLPPGKK
jgi:hypothetical protein